MPQASLKDFESFLLLSMFQLFKLYLNYSLNKIKFSCECLCLWSIFSNILVTFTEIDLFKFSTSWDKFARKILNLLQYFSFAIHWHVIVSQNSLISCICTYVSFLIPYLVYFCQYFFNLIKESRLINYLFYWIFFFLKNQHLGLFIP